jgi:hypothetical protein
LAKFACGDFADLRSVAGRQKARLLPACSQAACSFRGAIKVALKTEPQVSNHLAIATVTAALGRLVHDAAQRAVGGVDLRFGRPTAAAAEANERKLHVYLYLVTPNSTLRDVELPAREQGGRPMRRPRAALDLHYLISFYGDERLLEPDRMLGAVARELHTRPVLDARLIQDAIDGNADLVGSDLAAAVELVKLSVTQLSLEDLSGLWSGLVQAPHALSIACVGTVVLADALEGGSAALPGFETRLGPFPQLQAYWAGEFAAAGRIPRLPSFPAAQLGTRVLVAGSNLGGDMVALRLSHPRRRNDAIEIPIHAVDRNDRELRLTIPDDAAARNAWSCGVYSAQARVDRGGPIQGSNSIPLVIAPRVTGIAPNPVARIGGDAALTVICHPKVLPEQSVVLLIGDREVAALPFASPTDSIEFVVEDASALADQLVRIRVDGVDSFPFRYDPVVGAFVFDDAQRVTII